MSQLVLSGGTHPRTSLSRPSISTTWQISVNGFSSDSPDKPRANRCRADACPPAPAAFSSGSNVGHGKLAAAYFTAERRAPLAYRSRIGGRSCGSSPDCWRCVILRDRRAKFHAQEARPPKPKPQPSDRMNPEFSALSSMGRRRLRSGRATAGRHREVTSVRSSECRPISPPK